MSANEHGSFAHPQVGYFAMVLSHLKTAGSLAWLSTGLSPDSNDSLQYISKCWMLTEEWGRLLYWGKVVHNTVVSKGSFFSGGFGLQLQDQ